MTPAGWTVMISSVGAIVCLMVFCVRRVLSLPPVDADENESDD